MEPGKPSTEPQMVPSAGFTPTPVEGRIDPLVLGRINRLVGLDIVVAALPLPLVSMMAGVQPWAFALVAGLLIHLAV